MPFAYRDSGEYEVCRGDLWQVGNHRFLCSDVVEDPWLTELVAETPPAVIYSDPPWTDAIAKTFRTLSDLPEADYPWQAIYQAIAGLRPEGAPLWLVTDRYSADWFHDDWLPSIAPGEQRLRWWLSGLTTPTVLAVLHLTMPVIPESAWQNNPCLTNAHDHLLPGLVLQHTPGLILDPCSGLGLTSRAAEALGLPSLNNELSPLRLGAAINKTGRRVRQQPVLLTQYA
jgi:hypothetical protein